MGKSNIQEQPGEISILISIGLFILWLLISASYGGWIPMMISTFLLIPIFLLSLLFLLFSAVRFIVLLITKKPIRRIVIVILILIGAYIIFYILPTKPAVVFLLNRDEFISLVEEAETEYKKGGSYEFPEDSPYQEAIVYMDFYDHGGLIVEFFFIDFYIPLVYTSTDRPEDVVDACSGGGAPIQKIESNWYVCKRGWN